MLAETASSTSAFLETGNKLLPAAMAAGGGYLAQVVANRIVSGSVQHRLKKNNFGANDSPIVQTKAVLAKEIRDKQVAFTQSVPYTLLTLLVGQVAVFLHSGAGWFQHMPSMLALGADYAFNVFFHSLDNIQDEVEALGKPRKAEMAALFGATGILTALLLKCNKLYVLKAVSILFSTVMAKTDDSAIWKVFGGSAFAAIVTAISFAGRSLPGPAWSSFAKVLVTWCGTCYVYEMLTAKENAWNAPEWVYELVHTNFLHYAVLSVLTLSGAFPASWLLRELFMYVVYFKHKLQQHTSNYNLVVKHEKEAAARAAAEAQMVETDLEFFIPRKAAGWALDNNGSATARRRVGVAP